MAARLGRMLGQAVRGELAPATRRSLANIPVEAIGRRLRPARAEDIIANINRRAPEIRSARSEGFTYDPIRDRFLSREQGDVGTMMAVRPELTDGERLINAVGDMSPEEVERMFAENPRMLEDLRRGAMLGGYASPDRGFVLDASRRYGSLDRARRKGYLTRQDSGFDLIDESFPVPYSRYTAPPSLAALAILTGDTEGDR